MNQHLYADRNEYILRAKKKKVDSSARSVLMAFALMLFLIPASNAQISITGPTCVVAGTAYTYTISGSWTTQTLMSWTLVHGVITGTSNTAASGRPMVSISVTWNAGQTSGSVALATTTTGGVPPNGNASSSVTIGAAFDPGHITLDKTQNISSGSVPAMITTSGPTGGYCTAPTHVGQWQSSPDNVNYANLSGQISTSLIFSTGLTQTSYYRRMVTETNSGTIGYTDVATVFVYPPLQGGTIAASAVIDYNTAPAAFTNTLDPSGSSCTISTYTYLWQQSIDNINFTDMAASTAKTLTMGPLTQTTYFRRKVMCGAEFAYSNTLTITVNPPLYPGRIAQLALNISSNTSPGALIADAASGGACNNIFAYQWQVSTDGTSYTDIGGATNPYYTPGNLTATTYYRRKATCGNYIQFTNACQVIVGTTLSILNYIRVRDISKPGVTDIATANALTDPNDVKQTTQYFDGLSRLTETVARQTSPLSNDLVSLDMYDQAGREILKYLPYVVTTNDGNNKLYPVSELLTFNNTQFSGEQYYMSYVNTESSPLNRGQVSYSPGANWLGAGRGITSQSMVNSDADSVRIWYIDPAIASVPTSTTRYDAGQLMIGISTDEQGKQVVEYKDKDGHTILKKVQLAAAPGTAHVGWLCTYYVYDDLNNLRYVIQPKAVDALLLAGVWTLSTVTNLTTELCFRYEYDQRSHLIIKKIPGAGEEWMVYDARDRMAMRQDSSLRRFGKWQVNRYDSENRLDTMGYLADANNRAYHQNLAGSIVNYPANISAIDLQTKTYYDDYSWVSGPGLSATVASSYATNATYFNTSYNTSPVYAQPIAQNSITRGMVTGTKIKVLAVSLFLFTANLYDDRGRIIQSQSSNYSGGKDTLLTQYDFSGKALRSLVLHRKAGTNPQNHKSLTKLAYDANGRLTMQRLIKPSPPMPITSWVNCRINNWAITWITLPMSTISAAGSRRSIRTMSAEAAIPIISVWSWVMISQHRLTLPPLMLHPHLMAIFPARYGRVKEMPQPENMISHMTM